MKPSNKQGCYSLINRLITLFYSRRRNCLQTQSKLCLKRLNIEIFIRKLRPTSEKLKSNSLERAIPFLFHNAIFLAPYLTTDISPAPALGENRPI